MTYNILFSQQRQCFLYCEADQPQEEDVGVKSPDIFRGGSSVDKGSDGGEVYEKREVRG
jgi:hypothetical protein